MELIAAGKCVYDMIIRWERDLTLVQETLESIRHAEGTALVIAGTPTILAHYVPEVLKQLWLDEPTLSIRTLTRKDMQITAAVAAGEADVGLQTSGFLDSELQASIAFVDEILPVVAPGHPLAGRPRVSATDLSRHKLAFGILANESGRLVHEWLLKHHVALDSYLALSSVDAARSAALENLAIGFVGYYAARDDLLSGRLVRLPLEDFQLSRPIYAIHRPATTSAVNPVPHSRIPDP